MPKAAPTTNTLNSNNANIRADNGATAINQLVTKDFVVNTKDYTVKIYNTANYSTPKASQNTEQRIRNIIKQVQSLLAAGYDDEAEKQISAAFAMFFASPELVTSEAGQLTLTNLHILKGQYFEKQGQVASAVSEYLKPMKLLESRPSLRADYIKRVIDKPVFLKTSDGVAYLISQWCGAAPEKTCPKLLNLRVRRVIEESDSVFPEHSAKVVDWYLNKTSLDTTAFRYGTPLWPVIIARVSLVNLLAKKTGKAVAACLVTNQFTEIAPLYKNLSSEAMRIEDSVGQSNLDIDIANLRRYVQYVNALSEAASSCSKSKYCCGINDDLYQWQQ